MQVRAWSAKTQSLNSHVVSPVIESHFYLSLSEHFPVEMIGAPFTSADTENCDYISNFVG